MFGYATDETEECMPLTVTLSHALNRKISDMRRDGTLWWARPDSKTQVGNNIKPNVFHILTHVIYSQVTCEYYFDNGACVPTRVHTVVVSVQHSEKVTLEALRSDIMEKVIKTTIPSR